MSSPHKTKRSGSATPSNNKPSSPPSSSSSPGRVPASPAGSSSFTAIIDEDHAQINALGVQFGQLLAPDTPQTPELRRQRLALLQVLAWRLVRHDFAEDVVMRPAFERYLGHEGKAMSDGDRADHEHARTELVSLHAAFEALAPADLGGLALLRDRYAALGAELASHMRTESGQSLPRLERTIGRAENEELGTRYLHTMVVEPGLVIAGRSAFAGGAASTCKRACRD